MLLNEALSLAQSSGNSQRCTFPAPQYHLRWSYFQDPGRLCSSAHPTICQVRTRRCVSLCELRVQFSALSQHRRSLSHTPHTHTHPVTLSSQPCWVMCRKVRWTDSLSWADSQGLTDTCTTVYISSASFLSTVQDFNRIRDKLWYQDVDVDVVWEFLFCYCYIIILLSLYDLWPAFFLRCMQRPSVIWTCRTDVILFFSGMWALTFVLQILKWNIFILR